MQSKWLLKVQTIDGFYAELLHFAAAYSQQLEFAFSWDLAEQSMTQDRNRLAEVAVREGQCTEKQPAGARCLRVGLLYQNTARPWETLAEVDGLELCLWFTNYRSYPVALIITLGHIDGQDFALKLLEHCRVFYDAAPRRMIRGWRSS